MAGGNLPPAMCPRKAIAQTLGDPSPGCICSAALGSPHRAATGPVRAPSLCVHPSSLRGYVVHALRNACTSARVPRACRPRGNGHVGTWLAATPPVSALAAIDEGFPDHRAAPTNPLFVQLPSMGTWLVANASMAQRLVPPAQAAFAQPHSVAHTEPPLAQSVRPACAFTHLPSVATWLAAKPAQVAAEVSDPAEPTRQPSPGSTPTGDWWLAFRNSLQQTLCCGRGK